MSLTRPTCSTPRSHRSPIWRTEETVNLAMLCQSAKVYRVHPGKVHAPFYENDPRDPGPNFY